ncbi:MAG: MFS transporter [Dehalococcoidia bacterium]|jgi:MFS family permease|nr:MFS transporter [Dehalococcoidia bacterium]
MNCLKHSSAWTEVSVLLTANTLSMIGNSLSTIAIPWFVFELTGSAIATAGIVLAGQLPNLVVGLISGPFIDRFSARTVSLFSDAVNFIAILLIPLLFSLNVLDMVMLGFLVFLS